MRPQTIQIYLPFGNPRGFRQAEITTRTVRAFEIPRPELTKFTQANFPEAEQPGVYFLFGQDETGDPLCYIGESDNVRKRLSEHDAKKDFWTHAVGLVSLTNTWTKAHIQFLEFQSIKRAKQAASYVFTNGQEGHFTQIPAPLRADCEEFFETIQVLVSTLGYSVMEVPDEEKSTSLDERFYIDKVGVRAVGTYNSNGMTVFEGSTARPITLDKEYAKGRRVQQEQLLSQGVLEQTATGYRFVKNHTFSSPSGASFIILGRSSNGWDDWMDKQGRPLKSVKRSSLEGAA